MGIRYGRVPHASEEVEWSFVPHTVCDGIGGFVRLLRERGAEIPMVPQSKHACRGLIGPFWRLWCASRGDQHCADRGDWKRLEEPGTGPSDAVAWHLFTEEETMVIRENARREPCSVNSLLLKHLDDAIRPEIKRPDLTIPWMIPVNMRGAIRHPDDTENHVSCVHLQIAAADSPAMIHQQLHRRLEEGEHQANQLLLGLGKFLSHAAKVGYLTKDRTKPAGNIGSFSNLGVWDTEKRIVTNDSWLFCPPVVRGQLLGAGCVTFQNRLGLSLQGHTHMPPLVAGNLMKRWLCGLRRRKNNVE